MKAISILSTLFLQIGAAHAFLPSTKPMTIANRASTLCHLQNGEPDEISTTPSRRQLLEKTLASLVLLPVSSSFAEDAPDLASTMFNEDGSLKEGIESVAKQRLVEFGWDVSDQLNLNEDGKNMGNTKGGSAVKISYEFPQKWSDGTGGDVIYYDRSEGTNAKACKRITVYQVPGVAEIKQLEKAATKGVAQSLSVPPALDRLVKADVISGRVSKRNDQTYFEFDMAAAPATCGDSKENLGLGFCPYDAIFLLSACIVSDRMYVMAVECDSTRIWKLASAELKRVRSSFTITEA